MPAPISAYVPQLSAATRRRARVAWAACAAAAAAVVGLTLLAPLARSWGWAVAAEVLYRSFAVACHQMPERAFQLAGHPLAVCARCAGLYAGVLAGLAAYPLARPLARTDAPWRGWLFAAAAPTTADFLLGVTGVWENTHASRFSTALVLGAVAAFYIAPGLIELGLSARLRVARGGAAAEGGSEPARAGRKRGPSPTLKLYSILKEKVGEG